MVGVGSSPTLLFIAHRRMSFAPTGSGGALQLTLSPRQPYVLNGHDGIIQQGPGGPSAYYSNPRLAATLETREMICPERSHPADVPGQGAK